MKYKKGDRLRVITQAFEGVWVVDYIKTETDHYPSLYICYREDDEHKTLYTFLETEVVKEIRTLEEIQSSITQ